MKDKDKLWIEYKVNVGCIANEDIPALMTEIGKTIVSKDGSVMTLIIPVRDEESDVRLIYDPKGKHNKYQLNLAKKYMEKVVNEYKGTKNK